MIDRDLKEAKIGYLEYLATCNTLKGNKLTIEYKKYIDNYLKKYKKTGEAPKLLILIKIEFLRKIAKDNPGHQHLDYLLQYIESHRNNIVKNTPEMIIKNLKEFVPDALLFFLELEGI